MRMSDNVFNVLAIGTDFLTVDKLCSHIISIKKGLHMVRVWVNRYS